MVRKKCGQCCRRLMKSAEQRKQTCDSSAVPAFPLHLIASVVCQHCSCFWFLPLLCFIVLVFVCLLVFMCLFASLCSLAASCLHCVCLLIHVSCCLCLPACLIVLYLCVVYVCVWSVQWKVPGLAGRHGHSVRCPAAAGTTSGCAHAQAQRPPMEGTSASGCIQRRLCATHTPARVSPLSGPATKQNWLTA